MFSLVMSPKEKKFRGGSINGPYFLFDRSSKGIRAFCVHFFILFPFATLSQTLPGRLSRRKRRRGRRRRWRWSSDFFRGNGRESRQTGNELGRPTSSPLRERAADEADFGLRWRRRRMKAKVQRWVVDWTDSLRRSLVRSTGGETKVAGWRRARRKALKATENGERSLSQVKETPLQWTVMRCTRSYSSAGIESSE